MMRMMNALAKRAAGERNALVGDIVNYSYRRQ
jgi:hypothetical protein